MLFFQYDNVPLLFSGVPLNGEIAVRARKLVSPPDSVAREMRLYFVLPKVEALAFWNPPRCDPDIGNHELNRPRFKQLADIFAGQ